MDSSIIQPVYIFEGSFYSANSQKVLELRVNEAFLTTKGLVVKNGLDWIEFLTTEPSVVKRP